MCFDQSQLCWSASQFLDDWALNEFLFLKQRIAYKSFFEVRSTDYQTCEFYKQLLCSEQSHKHGKPPNTLLYQWDLRLNSALPQ